VLDIIREDLYEIKDKFGDKRRTEIGPAVTQFQMEELIPEERVMVTITRDGYIKRVGVEAYRKQGRGGKGVKAGDTKEGDLLEHLFSATTHDYLLVFTNRGRVYWLKVYDIPAMQRTSRGRSMANLLQMQPAEVHRAIVAVQTFEERFVFFATARGIVKKTPLAAFSHPRSNGIIAMGLDADDELIGAAQTSGTDEIVLGMRNGLAIRFDEQDVRAMGRTARGVKGVALRGDDRVVDLVVTTEEASLLTVCQYGFGKRTQVGEYRKTHRGGKGVINIKTTERNGKVVALKSVTETDEFMVISARGIILRTDLSQLREIGRATQGVRLIRVGEGDEVVAVAKIIPEDDENGNGETGSQERDGPAQEPTDRPSPEAGESSETQEPASEAEPAGPQGELQGGDAEGQDQPEA
jgi:DNA gyrase subunit A